MNYQYPCSLNVRVHLIASGHILPIEDRPTLRMTEEDMIIHAVNHIKYYWDHPEMADEPWRQDPAVMYAGQTSEQEPCYEI